MRKNKVSYCCLNSTKFPGNCPFFAAAGLVLFFTFYKKICCLRQNLQTAIHIISFCSFSALIPQRCSMSILPLEQTPEKDFAIRSLNISQYGDTRQSRARIDQLPCRSPVSFVESASVYNLPYETFLPDRLPHSRAPR